MIEIKDLNFSYNNEKSILKNIDLVVKKNEHVVIVGKSGSGKTTLLKLLSGIETNYTGSLLIDGIKMDKIRTSTGIIFQDNALFPWLTIRKNLELGLLSNGKKKEDIQSDIYIMLENFSIEEEIDKYPKDLSGGQLRRANIARSLLLNPNLILMDEPTSSLDSFNKENFQDIIIETQKTTNITSVLVTHDIQEALLLGQKVVILVDGEIKKIVDSKYYGKSESRDDAQFYEEVIALRQDLLC